MEQTGAANAQSTNEDDRANDDKPLPPKPTGDEEIDLGDDYVPDAGRDASTGSEPQLGPNGEADEKIAWGEHGLDDVDSLAHSMQAEYLTIEESERLAREAEERESNRQFDLVPFNDIRLLLIRTTS